MQLGRGHSRRCRARDRGCQVEWQRQTLCLRRAGRPPAQVVALPQRHALRARAFRGATASALAALLRCTTEHGILVELPEVRHRKQALPRDERRVIPSSRKYYTDGSCLRFRLPEVRVAASAAM